MYEWELHDWTYISLSVCRKSYLLFVPVLIILKISIFFYVNNYVCIYYVALLIMFMSMCNIKEYNLI